MLLSFLDTLEVKEVDSDKYKYGHERGYEDAIEKACEWLHTALTDYIKKNY